MIGVSKERDVLSNNRRKENVFSNNNSSKQRCVMSTGMLIMWLVIMFGMMYFLMIRPQKKEQKKLQAMLNDLAVGDAVITTSGFYGVVIDITDDDVIVEFGNNKNCRIPMRKTAITEVEKPETAVVEEKTEKKK